MIDLESNRNDHRKKFLTADWKNLAMLNFAVPDTLLDPFVPTGTELDPFEGKVLVSVVGFQFQHTRLKGFLVPFHSDFSEVNLRFYIRRRVNGQWRRGVVFIREIVAKRAVSCIARWFYGEQYITRPMRQTVELPSKHALQGKSEFHVEYQWQTKSGGKTRWNKVGVVANGAVRLPEEGSIQNFIVEHYWGYSKQDSGKKHDSQTTEYRVEHPPWQVISTAAPIWDCDVSATYGDFWAPYLSGTPHSALLAIGSNVSVFCGKTI